jgi:hypothetical protein
MFQHHIQLKTPEQLSSEDALNWYKVVEQFGPENIIYTRQKGDHFVALEYGICEDCEFPHTYIVTLQRDMTADEAQFIVQAWEYLYEGDCDIELSSNFDAGVMGANIDNNMIDIDPDLREQAISEMNKWNHNRWYQQKINEGWRYGGYFNSKQKTHPALRDWDSLTESHRRGREYTDLEIAEWIHRNKQGL